MKWKYVGFLFGVVGITFLSLVGVIEYYGFGLGSLADISFYENLANPSIRIVKVPEGLRKEETADVMAKKLGWNTDDKDQFINAHLALGTKDLEGKYFPQSYMIDIHSTPIDVSNLMFNTYVDKTKDIEPSKTMTVINRDTALKVASIIQREAAGKSDMRLISGIIWNRIFAGMKLQVDATLQYAKGNDENWWPQIGPKDKTIDSPYNTYEHTSLPPTPIANPGLAAIEAAYNPEKTSCLFYLHDAQRRIHCSKTYQGHVQNIKRYY